MPGRPLIAGATASGVGSAGGDAAAVGWECDAVASDAVGDEPALQPVSRAATAATLAKVSLMRTAAPGSCPSGGARRAYEPEPCGGAPCGLGGQGTARVSAPSQRGPSGARRNCAGRDQKGSVALRVSRVPCCQYSGCAANTWSEIASSKKTCVVSTVAPATCTSTCRCGVRVGYQPG